MVWRPLSREPLSISAQTLYCQKLESLGYTFIAHSMGHPSNFRVGVRKTHVFWNTVRNSPSRSSKVVNFDTNWKRVYDFLQVINSNLILPRFRDIAGFRRAWPHPYSTGILGVFPSDYIADVVAPRNEDPKLIIISVINFELVQPICPWYINVTDGRTDDLR